MPSEYVQPSEYILYGLPTSTTQPQVHQASLLIDAYLRRPEGMVWMPDAFTLPCYMAGLTPDVTFSSQGSITPGKSVAVPLTKQVPLWSEFTGRVAILDRANTSLVEAVSVSAIATGQLTFTNVVNSHSPNCTIEFGFTIKEQRPLPPQRAICTVSRPPVRLLSGMGRYAYGRRLEQEMGLYADVNLLTAVSTFGGPPLWIPFDITQVDISENTRTVWTPAGIMMSYYSEVRLEYLSGYSYSSLPPIIKQATAQIVAAFQSNPELSGQLKSISAGDTKIERFAPSQLDADTRQLLDNYRISTVI